jgi:AhpC/TSA family
MVWFTLWLATGAWADRVPVLDLQRIDKPELMASINFEAPATLLALWRANCVECRSFLEQAAKLSARFGSQGLQTFGLFSDTWSAYLEAGKNQDRTGLPHLHDPGQRTMRRLGTKDIPTLILIGKGGRVVFMARSLSEFPKLTQAVQSSLQGDKR